MKNLSFSENVAKAAQAAQATEPDHDSWPVTAKPGRNANVLLYGFFRPSSSQGFEHIKKEPAWRERLPQPAADTVKRGVSGAKFE